MIKDILKEFDKKFTCWDYESYCHFSKEDIHQFLSDKIKEAMESVKLEHKTFPEKESDEFDAGYNFAVDQMNNNIKNFMKPKTEPYYKQVKTSKLHCPYCHQTLWGDGSISIPYECECGKWNCSVEEKGFVWELTKKCD